MMNNNNSNNNLANQQQILLAEKLIALVARAFYNDSVIVLIDQLLYEKYIIEEEMAPRCQMTRRELDKIKNALERDGFIRFEEVTLEYDRHNKPTSSWKCYYIDYQHFLHLLRLRIYYMQQMLKEQENNELNEIYYQCPTCGNRYSSLDAQKLRAGDYKFVCSNCFQGNDFRTVTQTEEYYRLVQIDNRKTVKTIQSLQKKLDHQLNVHRYVVPEPVMASSTSTGTATAAAGGTNSSSVTVPAGIISATASAKNSATPKKEIPLHEGIFQLLHELRDVNLPRNLPSENINKGILASTVTDKQTAEEIAYNLEAAKRGKYGSHMNKKSLDQIKREGAGVLGSMNQYQPKTTFSINILPEGVEAGGSLTGLVDIRGNLSSTTAAQAARQDALEASLPEFVQGSHVFRADKVLQSVNVMQQEREQSNNRHVPVKKEEVEEEENERNGKRPRTDDYSTPVPVAVKEEAKTVLVAPIKTEVQKQDLKEEQVAEEDDLFGDVAWEQEEDQES